MAELANCKYQKYLIAFDFSFTNTRYIIIQSYPMFHEFHITIEEIFIQIINSFSIEIGDFKSTSVLYHNLVCPNWQFLCYYFLKFVIFIATEYKLLEIKILLSQNSII